MRALVTGASGFIGHHLAAALTERGVDVLCLVRRTSDTERLKRLGVELVYGDVTDADSLSGPVSDVAIVYHLAGAIKGFRIEDLLRVNEAGCRNIARTCANASQPPTLVMVSSLAAAGPAEAHEPAHENRPPRPVSNYGRSKLAGEQAAAEFADAVPTSIIRPPIVYGEGDPATLEMFRPISRFGLHVVPGFAERRYSLVHADDLCAAIMAAGDRGERLKPDWDPDGGDSPGVYYAAGDEQPSYADLGRMIGAALDRPTRIFRMPEFTTWTAAAASEGLARLRGRPSIFNRDKVREATAGSWVCSAERAKSELGFSPTSALAVRLRQTADWYRQQGWL